MPVLFCRLGYNLNLKKPTKQHVYFDVSYPGIVDVYEWRTWRLPFTTDGPHSRLLIAAIKKHFIL